MAYNKDQLEELLSRALHEKWSFPNSHFVEGMERHYAPVRQFSTAVISDMIRKAYAVKKSRRSAPETAVPLPEPSEKLLAKPILYWLVCVHDPVASIIADSRDSYNISINAMLNRKLVEIVSRLDVTSDQKIQDMGNGDIKKKRPSDVMGAIRALKDPACDVHKAHRWSAVAACTALEVGLVVETEGFPDVICWNTNIAWIDSTGMFIRMCEEEAKGHIKRLTACLVNDAVPSMSALKGACTCLQVQRPWKRSRGGMINDIKQRLTLYGRQ